jgi:hypothetical protein
MESQSSQRGPRFLTGTSRHRVVRSMNTHDGCHDSTNQILLPALCHTRWHRNRNLIAVIPILTSVNLLIPTIASPKSEIGISQSGHYFTWRGKTRLILGDSGTQIVPMNLDIDYEKWIVQCAAEGHTAVHVWAFIGGESDDCRFGGPAFRSLEWAR